MKKVTKFLVALFAVAVIFASCNKESQIVGRWKISKITFENPMVAAMMTEFTQQVVGEVIEFKADGTVTADAVETEVSESEGNLLYSIDGNNITFTADMPSDTTVNFDLGGTYEILDKTKLKLNLGLGLPENELNMTELKFVVEADRE